jgi:phosphoglycolate phosphatase
MACRLAIFDFDGTLADSFPFLASVFDELADRHGFRRVEPHEVPALRRCDAREIMAHLGVPAWKLPLVARSFIGLMRDNAARVPLFEGIAATLKHLAERGIVLAIVSSNSRDNVEHVLVPDNASLISHFECGASIFGKRSRIRKVLRRSGIAKSEAIYIGDQSTDLDAARAEKVAFGAVAWGYGDIESLKAREPELAFAHASDITRVTSAAGWLTGMLCAESGVRLSIRA